MDEDQISNSSIRSLEDDLDNDGPCRLMGLSLDVTGRRLKDQIYQIAIYDYKYQHTQYVMPRNRLSDFAQKKLHLRIVSSNRHRFLKNLQTNKYYNCKSEYSSLIDLLWWIRNVCKDSSNSGVIFVYHDIRNFLPLTLMESIARFELQAYFYDLVKGFVNTYDILKNKYGKSMKSFQLNVLSRELLGKEEDTTNAFHRSRITYDLLLKLILEDDIQQETNTELNLLDHWINSSGMMYITTPMSYVLEVSTFQEILNNESTFRPVFKDLLKSNWRNRQQVSRLRRLITVNGIDYIKVKSAWDQGGVDSIIALLKTVPLITKKDLNDLFEILVCYFDPTKEPVNPSEWSKKHISSKGKIKTCEKLINQNQNLNVNENQINITKTAAVTQTDTTCMPEIQSKKVDSKKKHQSDDSILKVSIYTQVDENDFDEAIVAEDSQHELYESQQQVGVPLSMKTFAKEKDCTSITKEMQGQQRKKDYNKVQITDLNQAKGKNEGDKKAQKIDVKKVNKTNISTSQIKSTAVVKEETVAPTEVLEQSISKKTTILEMECTKRKKKNMKKTKKKQSNTYTFSSF